MGRRGQKQQLSVQTAILSLALTWKNSFLYLRVKSQRVSVPFSKVPKGKEGWEGGRKGGGGTRLGRRKEEERRERRKEERREERKGRRKGGREGERKEGRKDSSGITCLISEGRQVPGHGKIWETLVQGRGKVTWKRS